MAQTVLERCLSPHQLNAWFERIAEGQSHSLSGSGSKRCSRRVNASGAGGDVSTARTRAASVPLHAFGVASRKSR
jgi:hypothetical protein